MQNVLEENVIYTPNQSKALGLYMRQYTAREISEEIGLGVRAVQKWIKRFNWVELRQDYPIELTMRQRLAYLFWVDEKSERQLNELDVLLKHTFGDPNKRGGKAKDGSNRGRVSNKLKNDISEITEEKLTAFREEKFFRYQKKIHETKNNPVLNWIRFYLKSRQIGLTYYFAFEALEDAILTGDNQIFLSASKKQSEIFKTYIKMFALELGEVDLKGKDELSLSNGATLYFLSTNSRTGQGFHGHLYVDEAFWIPKFKEVDELIGGATIHDNWRTTYLSTPSSVAHEAYLKWAGEKGHNIEISHKTLKNGKLGADDIYRQMITVDDAIEGGANFFNLEKLRKKYPDKDVYDNLLRCVFLDDSKSVFSIKKLMACKADIDNWHDVDVDAARPVGNDPVWIGYDPSGEGDDAAIIVALPPKNSASAFRAIEKIRLDGESYENQAQRIKDLTYKYNVAELAIDTTGIGEPVAQLVEVFFPLLTRIVYSINTKNSLVYKAREVINKGRFLFDSSWDDVVHSFLMIKRKTTRNSNQSTFVATRTKDSSHADIAMASMHLFSLEGINIMEQVEPTIHLGD